MSNQENEIFLWGIKRWVLGIKEYLYDRPCGTFNIDHDRTYINKLVDPHITTDCICLSGYREPLFNQCTDLIIGCPLATMLHLLCLPWACFTNYQTINDVNDVSTLIDTNRTLKHLKKYGKTMLEEQNEQLKSEPYNRLGYNLAYNYNGCHYVGPLGNHQHR